ncbi:hypothetical protein FRC01_003414 [Tulasnella sp. 417]|nr:hypothetical protein FRC01_003414 [Tulasnella sp. 417]
MSSDVTNHVAITDIPPELIATILQYLEHNPTKTYYSDLVRISHSTSYLRQAAINAPNLWTSIEITDKPASFELAKACLDRSGVQPLDISIRMNKRLKSRLRGLLALVSYTASRLRSLDIRVCLTDADQDWAQIETCFQQLETPHLQNLRVEIVMFHERTSSPHRTLPIPHAANQLRTLSLSNTTPDPSSLPTLSTIKSLTISSKWFWDSPYQSLIQVLNAASSLEELTLKRTAALTYGPRRSPSSLPVIPSVNLPHLRHLTFRNVENDLLALLLTNMIAPELHEVTLDQTEGLNAADPNLRFAWNQIPISPSFHSVVSLDIDIQLAVVVHKDQLAVFLAQLFPNVKKLRMAWKTGREFVQAWTFYWKLINSPDAVGQVSSWPELGEIVLTGQDGVSCSKNCQTLLEDVGQLLQTREKHGLPPLDLLRFEVCEGVKTWEGYSVACHRIRELLSSPKALDILSLGKRDSSSRCSQ